MNSALERLEEAISAGRLDEAVSLVEQEPDLLWAERSGGMSPVVIALHREKLEIAQTLALRLLEAIRADGVPPDNLYGAIHDLGEAWHSSVGGGWEIAEPVVAQFLQHDEESLRYIAMNVLAYHWDTAKYREAFERALAADPDADNRAMAAGGLGFVLKGTRDSLATSLLLAKLRDEREDWMVRDSSYEALLEIWLGWERAWAIIYRRLFQGRTAKFAARLDELIDERDRAAAVGDDRRAEALGREIESAQMDGDDDWQRTVDWDLVDKIARGEIP